MTTGVTNMEPAPQFSRDNGALHGTQEIHAAI